MHRSSDNHRAWQKPCRPVRLPGRAEVRLAGRRPACALEKPTS